MRHPQRRPELSEPVERTIGHSLVLALSVAYQSSTSGEISTVQRLPTG
jgi:hypothetical protein